MATATAPTSSSQASGRWVEPVFALLYRPGPSWIEGKPIHQQPLAPHRAYIADLFAAGRVLMAGPFQDAESGGLALLRAPDVEAAREIQARDPAIVAGIFEGVVRPWHPLFDSRSGLEEEVAILRRAEANAEVVRRVLEAARERDLPTLLQLYAADVEIHDAKSLPYGGVYHGHGGTIENGRRFVETWDPVQTPEDRDLEERVFVSGNVVFALWRAKATGKDGTRLDSPAISLFDLRAGKVARLQMFHYDTAGIRDFFDRQRDASASEERRGSS